MNDSLHGFDFNTCERKALVNPIPNLNSVTSPETGGIASWVAQSVSETVIVNKMPSHWNWSLHFGTCSIFPKGNGSEYNKIGCHEKNNVELKDRITPHGNFFQRIPKRRRSSIGKDEMEIKVGNVCVCVCVNVCVCVSCV